MDEIGKYIPSAATINRLRLLHFNKIPIIIYLDKSINNNSDMRIYKYMIDRNQNMRNIIYNMRKKIGISKYQAIFAFHKNNIINLVQTVGEFYDLNGDNIGYMIITLSSENVFGYKL